MGKVITYSRPEPVIGQMTGLITVPDGWTKEEKLPMILFLHGAGERGKSTPETVERVRVHGIAKYFCADPDYHGLRVITASPQCPEDMVWDHITTQLLDWMQAVIEEYGADTERIALTGLSMGGYGTWNMLTMYPDLFCCAAPICGGGVSWFARQRLGGKKIRVFHSVDDDLVPYERSVEMASAAQMSGAQVELTTYMHEGHGSWVKAYEQTDLIEWLCTTTK